MSCYVAAHLSAAPNAASFLISNPIADVECHVLSSWFDSTRIALQSISRIIHTSRTSFNGGAAGIICVSMRSGDITPELTGRAHNAEAIQVLDESLAIRAPVE
jgi:hypothetical protein